ncbi:adenine phosphoribosyltransferase [Bacteriovoracaceae bacterium]|nr:adenine phosphoribosyltransferase [Bacteriovoracaceae bacterium]
MSLLHPSNKEEFEKYILDVENFPKENVVFKDISPLLANKFTEVVTAFSQAPIDWSGVEHIIGIESRGFILGSALAIHLNKGFIPIRKKGKLPPPVYSQSYQLEYGEDILEMKEISSPSSVVLVDDVLATGGTIQAAAKLCERNNFSIKAKLFLINLTFLNQLKESNPLIHSLIEY